ncbi:Lrp/AsnC family leucine-responsive transcriptional regulator [Brevibacillus sp. 1238]|uniref:AsnC family transcriptional regulator n=1 Tax=Brevibacillus parabrevis TaxID=54914 RepID=A0A4Y3PLY4_BREPA|nr:Lrp/AsnC family leucine-responsive transcriptional regulator [Brevibacillus sp. 1238]GEB33845.1 AsnC family transcriptional regulator [Brevibacillus parabrevis]
MYFYIEASYLQVSAYEIERVIKVDQVDYKIISLLHENSRIPLAEMGRIIGMTQPAVKERVRRLEEQGVITGYHAAISQEKLGKHTTAFVMFRTKQCAAFIDFCKQAPEVTDMYRISGEYNYMLKVVTRSTEELVAFSERTGDFGYSYTLIVLTAPFEQKMMLEEEKIF